MENIEEVKIVKETEGIPVSTNMLSLDSVEESRNRILPKVLEGGKGIPAVLHKIPSLTEVGDNKLPALALEFFKKDEEAYCNINFILPNLPKAGEVQSEQDKKLLKGNTERFKHILAAFIPTEGLTGATYVEIAQAAVKRMEESKIAGTACEIKLVYNKKNSIISFPSVGDCISTSLRKKNLSWNPEYDLSLPVKKGGGDLTPTLDVGKMNEMM